MCLEQMDIEINDAEDLVIESKARLTGELPNTLVKVDRDF
jgi:hypothetical protein